MRFALLTLPADNDADHDAELRIGGKDNPHLQAEFAIALGCKRFFLFCERPGPSAFALQSFCEGAGCKVQLIRDAKPLLAAVKAEDGLLVLSPEIVPLSQAAATILTGSPAILAIDADDANADQFERIDINHRWAGALTAPGRIVAQLAEMPVDADFASTLLRLGLQGRVGLKQLPEREQRKGNWVTLDNAGDLPASIAPSEAEASVSESGPSGWLAKQFVAATAPLLLKRTTSPAIFAIAATALAVLGAGASLLNIWAALAIIAVSWIFNQCIPAYEDFLRTPFAQETRSVAPYVGWIIDLSLIAALFAGAISTSPLSDWPPIAFGAVTLVGLVRLARRICPPKIASFASDRALVGSLLIALGLAVGIPNAIYVSGAALLALILWYVETAKKDNRELTESK